MSMRNFGCTGHVIPLSELEKIIGLDHMDQVINATDSKDIDEITELVNSFIPESLPKVETVFILGGEDESEELEQDVWYAIFAEGDLYQFTPSPGLIALRSFGMNPEPKNWVMFG